LPPSTIRILHTFSFDCIFEYGEFGEKSPPLPQVTFRDDLSLNAPLQEQKSHCTIRATPGANRTRFRLTDLASLQALTPRANARSTCPAGNQIHPAAVAQTPLIA